MAEDTEVVEFDDIVGLALAVACESVEPRPELKEGLMATVAVPAAPKGFKFRLEADRDWLPHPVPGIQMKVLALNRASGYATLLLDVAPGTRFPPHYHE